MHVVETTSIAIFISYFRSSIDRNTRLLSELPTSADLPLVSRTHLLPFFLIYYCKPTFLPTTFRPGESRDTVLLFISVGENPNVGGSLLVLSCCTINLDALFDDKLVNEQYLKLKPQK
jgi:hypothetical protein